MHIERDEEEIENKENQIFENLLKESCDIENRKNSTKEQKEETLTWAQLRARRTTRWVPLGHRYVRLGAKNDQEKNAARRSF